MGGFPLDHEKKEMQIWASFFFFHMYLSLLASLPNRMKPRGPPPFFFGGGGDSPWAPERASLVIISTPLLSKIISRLNGQPNFLATSSIFLHTELSTQRMNQCKCIRKCIKIVSDNVFLTQACPCWLLKAENTSCKLSLLLAAAYFAASINWKLKENMKTIINRNSNAQAGQLKTHSELKGCFDTCLSSWFELCVTFPQQW